METTTFGVDRTSREQRCFGGQTKHCRSTSLGIMTIVPVIVTFMAAIFALSVGGGGSSQSSDTTVPDPSSMLETRRLAGGDYGNKAKEEYAVIFPVFILVIGVVMHYVLGRVAHHVFPYTAAMFLLGVFLGALLQYFPQNQLRASMEMWSNIDGHVLLLVFLPGLLFKDAFSLDIHLFRKAFGQCLIMAFPQVLAGTALTAVVLAYVIVQIPSFLPYFGGGIAITSTTFIGCMVLGSILSATDPVAVGVLLNEVGAPPRLKTHIAGESLLNDGAAIVFFNIFYKLELYRVTGGNLGSDYDWGSGIVYFLKLSLGSAVLGCVFGLVLTGCLWLLNHRYNYEESVVQVMMTAGMAYLSFYIGEAVLHWSGVICVVFCAAVTKAYGDSYINDHHAMQKFWDLTEHILNTILFALGGLIWGTVVVGNRNHGLEGFGTISGSDFGFLVLLYLFLLLIRAFLISAFYPIISRIGLKTTWQESVFMSWAGLRGAIGIALGILIENAWNNLTPDDLHGKTFENNIVGNEILDLGNNLTVDFSNPSDVKLFEFSFQRYFIQRWFFFAGGISLLTLVINGSTAGPLLKKLGLANTTKIRESIVKRYKSSIVLQSFERLLSLVGDDIYAKFGNIDYRTVLQNVPYFNDITVEQFNDAVKKCTNQNKALSPTKLSTFQPFFPEADCFSSSAELGAEDTTIVDQLEDAVGSNEEEESPESPASKEETIEVRKVFVELLEKSYDSLIENGFVDPRALFLLINIKTSISRLTDIVARGEPINARKDAISKPATVPEAVLNRGKRTSADVWRSVACIEAHRKAQEAFRVEFGNNKNALSSVEASVLEESNDMIRHAEDVISSKDVADVENILMCFFCRVLLNEMVSYAVNYKERGLLTTTECDHLVHSIDHYLLDLDHKNGKFISDEKADETNGSETLLKQNEEEAGVH